VDDQVSSPTWARSLAEATSQVIAQGLNKPMSLSQSQSGIYHFSGKGSCSRFDWAKAILEIDPKKQEHKTVLLLPAKSDDFPSPATRPKISRMDTNKFQNTFKLVPSNWTNELELSLSTE
jgi:dTDP-4-dehydrorhamnose reductase